MDPMGLNWKQTTVEQLNQMMTTSEILGAKPWQRGGELRSLALENHCGTLSHYTFFDLVVTRSITELHVTWLDLPYWSVNKFLLTGTRWDV